MAKPKRVIEHPAAAADALENLFAQIYALDDMTGRFEASPFSFLTMDTVIEALVDIVKCELNAIERMLPAGHPALPDVETARKALDHLMNTLQNAYDGGDGSHVSPCILGPALHAYVIATGRAVERAVRACENVGVSGYLNENRLFDPCRRATPDLTRERVLQ